MFIGAGQTIFDAHWMLLWLREMNKGRDYATDVAAADEHGDLQCTGLLSQDAMHFEHRVLSAAEDGMQHSLQICTKLSHMSVAAADLT